MMTTDPVAMLLDRHQIMVIDGGLATALEAAGCDLNDPLWSARVLLEAPDRIRAAHLAFLRAGADCIITASYQASFAGLAARGLAADECGDLLIASVAPAVDARAGRNRW